MVNVMDTIIQSMLLLTIFPSAIASKIEEEMKSDRVAQPITRYPSVYVKSSPELLRSLAAAGRAEAKVTGLRRGRSRPNENITISDLKANANLDDILDAIGDGGKSDY